MTFGCFFTHEYNIESMGYTNFGQVTANIVSALASYNPIYTDFDTIARYVRAVVGTSDISSALYDSSSGVISVTLTGSADVATKFYLFTEGSDIHSTLVEVPPFTGTVTVSYTIFAPSAHVYIDPLLIEKTINDVGKTFKANVTLKGVTDLKGFDFKLSWDSSLLTLTSVDFNTTLDNIWGSENWFCALNESGAGWYKLVALSTKDSFNSTDSQSLFILEFQVEDPHSNFVRETPIQFAVHKLSDSNAQPIEHTVEDGTYRISGETPLLTLSPTSKTCRKYNETFMVQVSFSGAYDVTDFKFEIHYNTTLLDYASVIWDAWNSGTIIVDEVNGNITGFTSGTAIGGTQTLLTIQFNATYLHIWKDESKVSGWKNDQSGTIYIQWANLSYSSGQELGYVRGGAQNQITVGPDVVYTFSPIKGDIDNNGIVDIYDLRTVAYYYDQVNSTYDLTGDNIIDIFDLVVIASNYGYSYDP
jgi:hypothetical protein